MDIHGYICTSSVAILAQDLVRDCFCAIFVFYSRGLQCPSPPVASKGAPSSSEDDSQAQDVDLSGLRIMMPVSRMSSLMVPEPGYNMLSSR